MNEERELANKQKVESPVHETIEETHACYNANLNVIINNMKSGDALFVGSHNVESVELAIKLNSAKGVRNNVFFGQLMGFSDQVTGNLANSGNQVYKYVPFGPTEQVMPYLIRRGQESKQVLREQQYQNIHLKNEIKRRLKLL